MPQQHHRADPWRSHGREAARQGARQGAVRDVPATAYGAPVSEEGWPVHVDRAWNGGGSRGGGLGEAREGQC